MDRLSVKILKYINKFNIPIDKQGIIKKHGNAVDSSISYLEKEGYIECGRVPVGCDRFGNLVFGGDGMYKITAKGKSFLEERPGLLFDKWSTRILAIWGAITGTIAILISIMQLFLQWSSTG